MDELAELIGGETKKASPISDKLLDSLRRVESGKDTYAVNKETKAMGPYQFMPDTVAMLHKQGIKFNPFDENESRQAAKTYLEQLTAKNGGDVNKALAQYGGFITKEPSQYVSNVTTGSKQPVQQTSDDLGSLIGGQYLTEKPKQAGTIEAPKAAQAAQPAKGEQGSEAVANTLLKAFQLKKQVPEFLASAADIVAGAPSAIAGTVGYNTGRLFGLSPEEATKASQKVASKLEAPVGRATGLSETQGYKQNLPTDVMNYIGKNIGESAESIAKRFNIPVQDVQNGINTLMLAAPVGVAKVKGVVKPWMEELQIQKQVKGGEPTVAPTQATSTPTTVAPATTTPTSATPTIAPKETPLQVHINKPPEQRQIQIIDENPVQKPVDSNEVAAKKELLARIGLNNVRTSALEGNHKEASSQFITSQASQEPYGAGMTDQINAEKDALNKHLQSVEEESGGHVVRHGTSFQEGDKIQIGKTLKNDLQSGYDAHIAEGKRLYQEADKLQGDKPVNVNQFNDFLGKKENFVYENEKNLQTGIKNYLDRSNLLDEDGNIKPLTVKQAEGLRQYINSKYHYETSALGGQLKGLIDKDVFEQVGGETYQSARKHWGVGKDTYENPKAVGDLLADNGVNQKISDEKVMTKVLSLDQSQFGHLFETLKADNKTDSVNQIKTSLVNEIRNAGQSAPNQPWNSIAAAKEAARLSEKLRVAFADDPKGLAKVMDGIDAGNVLHIPTKYPGAGVQTHLLKNKFSEMAIQRLFTTLGASGGAAAGGPLGAALGGAAGEKLGSTASQMKRNKRQVQQLEKEIQPTKLSDIGK